VFLIWHRIHNNGKNSSQLQPELTELLVQNIQIFADLPLHWVSASSKVFRFRGGGLFDASLGALPLDPAGVSATQIPIIDSRYTLAMSSAVPLLISFRRLCIPVWRVLSTSAHIIDYPWNGCVQVTWPL